MRILNASLKEQVVDSSIVLTICVHICRQAFSNEMKDYIDIIMENINQITSQNPQEMQPL